MEKQVNVAPTFMHDPLRLGQVLSKIDWIPSFDGAELVMDSEGVFTAPVPASVLWKSRSKASRWAVLSERGYEHRIVHGESRYELLASPAGQLWVVEQASTGRDRVNYPQGTISPLVSIQQPVAGLKPSQWPTVVTVRNGLIGDDAVRDAAIESLDEAALAVVYGKDSQGKIYAEREVVAVGVCPNVLVWRELVSEILSDLRGDEAAPIASYDNVRTM
jgi:hypothetical protein